MLHSSIVAQEIDSPKHFIAEWASAFNKNDHALILGFYEQTEDVELMISSGFRRQGCPAIQKLLEHSSPINGIERNVRIEEELAPKPG